MEQQSSISFSPPANRFVVTECERNVLAIMLHSRRAAIRVMEVLDASCFLEVQNQILFTHLINLITETKAAINYYELTFYLSEKNVLSKVGEKYLEAIFDEYVSSSFLEPNLNLILADARKQKLLRLARRITSSVEKNRDYLTICQESQEDINAILSSGRNLDFLLIKDLASAFYDKLNLLSKAETDITGVACGYYEVDNMTKGFQPGELIIIAARPGMGKTSFALNIINNFLNNFHSPVPPSCIFVSLEMPAEQLMARLYGLNTLILLKKFQTGKEITSQEWQQILNQRERFKKQSCFIEDVSGLTIYELTTKIRSLFYSQPEAQKPNLIVIDYLQLIANPQAGWRGNRQQEVAQISMLLKQLARELKIPILCLSQLSRAVEKREGSNVPRLSDLRDSGAIEQDADVVIFLYRPEYYQSNYDLEVNTSDQQNKIHQAIQERQHKNYNLSIIIAKNRNGPVGTAGANFDLKTGKIENANEKSSSF